MHEDDTRRELDLLRQRIERLEELLRLDAPETPPAAPPTPTPPAPPVIARPPAPATRVQPPPPPPPVAQTPRRAPQTTPQAPPATAPPTPPVSPARPVIGQPRPRIKQPPSRSFEFLIGAKVAAWIAAVMLVIAAAYVIKLGFDEGWWNAVSVSVRCLLVAGFGALLLLAGEFALRRFGKAASVGLYGAGLGVLYLDAYATTAFLHILPEMAAFALMAVTAAIGFAITLRTRFTTIGILSLVGGYLTPILLRGAHGHDLALLVFLSALFAVALALSAAGPKNFRVLRYPALGLHMFLSLLWLLDHGQGLWLMGIIFMSIWWSMLLFETLLAALRDQSPAGNPIAVLVATAGYVTAGAWILHAAPTGPDWLGLFTLAIGLLGAAVALQFGPGLEALRRPPRSAMHKFAVALWAQFGVLLAVAAALQFDGFGEAVSWLALAIAAIEIGRRLPSRGVDVFGLVVGAVGTTWVILLYGLETVGATSYGLLAEIWAAPQVTLTQWSLLGLLALLIAFAAAQRLRSDPPHPWRVMPVVLSAIGAFGWLTLTAIQCRELTITGAWIVGGAALLAFHHFGQRQRYLEIALFVLLAATGRWLLVDAIGSRLSDPSHAALTPFVNWQMGLALAIAACGASAVFLLNRRAARTPNRSDLAIAWQLVLMIAGIVLLIALSFELDRLVVSIATTSAPVPWTVGHVRQLVLTLLWTLGAVACGLFALLMQHRDERGTLRPPRLLAPFAWLLLAACAFKWLLWDTLGWTLFVNRPAALALPQVFNLQLFAGLGLAGGALLMLYMARRAADVAPHTDELRPRLEARLILSHIVPVAASLLVLWALTFEIDRAVARLEPARLAEIACPPPLLRALWWTGLWATGGLGMMLLGRWRKTAGMLHAGWLVIAAASLAWLGFDTLGWRLAYGVVKAPVILNLPFGIGALLIVVLALGTALWMRLPANADPARPRRFGPHVAAGFTLLAAVGLWIGSFEVDRHFGRDAQAALSVYWALYAVMLVILGFAKRVAAARYAGLTLWTVTIGKVLIVDLATVEQIWRVISTLVSGLLLVGTSLLYARLSPLLLPPDETADPR